MQTERTWEAQLGQSDYLAEALRVWDCYEQRWAPGSPTILRFESRDMLAWIGRPGNPPCELGELPRLQADDPLVGLWLATIDDEEPCLCWRRFQPLDHLAGSLLNPAELPMALLTEACEPSI